MVVLVCLALTSCSRQPQAAQSPGGEVKGTAAALPVVDEARYAAGLGRLQEAYRRRQCPEAFSELQSLREQVKDHPERDFELFTWAARVADGLCDDPAGTFHISALLYFVKGLPDTDWNAEEYLFARRPKDPALFFLNLLPSEEAMIPPDRLDSIKSAALYVQAARRFEKQGARTPDEADVRFLAGVERELKRIQDRAETRPTVDLAVPLARAYFGELKARIEKRRLHQLSYLLDVKAAKRGIQEVPSGPDTGTDAIRGIERDIQATYELTIEIVTQVREKLRLPEGRSTYGLMRLLGTVLLEYGIQNNDSKRIEHALLLLDKCQAIHSAKAIAESVARARAALGKLPTTVQ
jgi:hypothetical protein